MNEQIIEANSTFQTYTNVTAVFGTVKKIYPDTMTVDVYVPSTASVLQNITLGCKANGKLQKDISMPEENSPMLILYTSTGAKAVALGSFSTSKVGTDRNELTEIFLPGENMTMSSGLSGIKEDAAGNIFFTSGAGDTMMIGDGTLGSMSEAVNISSLARTSRSGISLSEIKKGAKKLDLSSTDTFYTSMDIDPTYTPDEVTDEIEKAIVTRAETFLSNLATDSIENAFSKKVASLESVYKNYNDDKAAEKIKEVREYLNGFILKKNKSRLEIASGAVMIDGSRQISTLGGNVILSTKVFDDKNNIVGEIQIDDKGNLNFSMTSISGLPGGGGGSSVVGGSVKTVAETDVPYIGAVIGDRYIDLVLSSGTPGHVYIPANDLVGSYASGDGIAIASNIISVKIDSASRGLSVGVDGIKLPLATTSSPGAMSATHVTRLNDISTEQIKQNTLIAANTAKRSYPLADEQKLSTISNRANANAPISTQSQAEAGTDDTVTMTPLKTFHSITKFFSLKAIGAVGALTNAAISASDSLVIALGKLQGQINVKANLASPVFTGVPIAPTAEATISSEQIATTEYVKSTIMNNLTTDNAGYSLDARQGKVLSDAIEGLKTPSDSVTIYVTDDLGQPIMGAAITVKNKNGAIIKSYVSTALPRTIKIDADIEYVISADEKDGYSKPEDYIGIAVAGGVTNVQMTYIKVIRYGFRRTRAESNPDARIEYLFDAVSMSPAFMDFTANDFSYGGWGSFCETICRPVMLNTDGSVAYELDKKDQAKKLDGTPSDIADTTHTMNAMVEFGSNFKWVKRYEDTAHEYVIFCNTQYDTEYKAYAHTDSSGAIRDSFYWGMFKGCNISGTLRSIADQDVTTSQTRNTEVTHARSNGVNWHTIYKSGWDYIGDLLTLISKSDNSQAKFGTGRSKANNTRQIATGSLKSHGAFKGFNDETSDVKVFWIEGFWGNTYESMAGMIYAANKLNVKMTPPYNFDGVGYHNTEITISGTNAGYCDTASVSEYGYLPKSALAGSATTYYCDSVWFTEGVLYALVSGYWNTSFRNGCRSLNLFYTTAYTSVAIGSRISFIPTT